MGLKFSVAEIVSDTLKTRKVEAIRQEGFSNIFSMLEEEVGVRIDEELSRIAPLLVEATARAAAEIAKEFSARAAEEILVELT